MKSFGLLILLFSSLAFASVQKGDPTPFTEKTYECAQYTDNEYSKKEGFKTDNPAINEITVIHQSETSFTIDKNKIWDKETVLNSTSENTRGGVGSNTKNLFFKKHNESGNPYFMVYFFDANQANRVVVLGQCTTK